MDFESNPNNLELRPEEEEEPSKRPMKHLFMKIYGFTLSIGLVFGVIILMNDSTRDTFLTIYMPIFGSAFIIYILLFAKYSSSPKSKTEAVIPTTISDLEDEEEDDDDDDDNDDYDVDVDVKSIKPSLETATSTFTMTDEDESDIITNISNGFADALSVVGSFLTGSSGDSNPPVKADIITSPTSHESEDEDEEMDYPVHGDDVDLSGTFKLKSSQHFDDFLKVQGISWTLRKAVKVSKPIHTYIHQGDSFHVKIDGIVKGESKFIVNGPPVPSRIRSLEFLDTATYLETDDTPTKRRYGIQVRKIATNNSPSNNGGGASEIIVKRTLSNDGQQLIMRSRAIGIDGTESLEAIQIFQRIT